MSKLRALEAPFVVSPPAGARVRTRLRVTPADEDVLFAVGRHLGSLAGLDLARRCAQGRLTAKEQAASRRERKQRLTAESSSRWAGAITRTSEDAWQLGMRNLAAERRSLVSRIRRIERRLTIAIGGRNGKLRGYRTGQEHYEKQRRLQHLKARLDEVERRIEDGRVSVCRGGARLARMHHHLDEAGIDEASWRRRWDAERLFVCADGEADQLLGNLTIRWNPDETWLELRLPHPLEHLANRPGGRYRLSCPVDFPHRGDEVAAQATSGAVRYDISLDSAKGRWYLDASWKLATPEVCSLEDLRDAPVVALDLNHGFLTCCALDQAGNPIAAPVTVELELDALATSARDGRLRAALSRVLALTRAVGARAIVVENLDFVAQREEGCEWAGRRPSRGRRGRSFRRLVAGLPTARLRDRLVQMATNKGLAVIAVDPAYTSRWGAQHWLDCVQQRSSDDKTGHHAAALVVGRRGLGHRARRRERCDSPRAEHRGERATDSVVPDVCTPPTEPEDREADGRSLLRQKTLPGERASSGDEATEDRSRSPARQGSALLSA